MKFGGMSGIFRLVFLILFWCSVAMAAPPAQNGKTLDLAACVARALEANPKIEQANQQVIQSEWKLKSARLARTPKMELFNLMGAVNNATEGNGEPAITGDTTDGIGFFNKLDVDISIPLYTFGRITRGIEAAKEGVAAQQAARSDAASDLVLDVHELYYGLIMGRQVLEETTEIQKNFTTARDIAEERLEKADPSVAEVDVLKLRVGLAGATKGLQRVEREVQVAKEALRRTLALGDREEFDVADRRLNPVEFKLQPLEHYLQQAEAGNPDMKRLKAGLAAQEAEYLAERAKYYPTILAVGGLNYAVAPGRPNLDNPFLKDDFHSSSFGGALAVKWDLNFFQTNAEVNQKRAQYLKVKSLFQEGKDGLMLQVKDRYYKLKEKEENLDSSQEARKAGRGILLLSLTNFKFGIGTGKDVFEGLSVYARTANEYYEAVFNFNMAVAELKAAVGNLYAGETTVR